METTNARKMTALSLAVLGNSLKTTRKLVERGAFMETRDEDGRTPLSLSVERSGIELIEYLVSHNADPLSVSSSGKGVVTYSFHRPSVVNILLENGKRLPPGTTSDMDKCLVRGIQITIVMYEHSFHDDFNPKYSMVSAYTVDDLHREIASVESRKMKVIVPVYVRQAGLQAAGVGGQCGCGDGL